MFAFFSKDAGAVLGVVNTKAGRVIGDVIGER